MNGVRSLGTHVPSGVSYLVAEKVLREDPPASSYSWQIFDNPEDPETPDELVVVNPHVVWSRGERVHRVFSFSVENEPIQQALFTWFTRQESDHDFSNRSTAKKLVVKKRKILTPKTPVSDGSVTNSTETAPEDVSISDGGAQRDRALVVVLKSHIQVIYIAGTRSIVPLNFDADRVFAFSEGLIIQRKAVSAHEAQKAKLEPKTPLNSFAFSQSFSQSPPTAPLPPNAVGSKQGLTFVNALFNSMMSDHESRVKAQFPAHYHLSDPLSELGVLGKNPNAQKSHHGNDQSELFPCHERLIYVSSTNEARLRYSDRFYSDLLFAVSINTETRKLNVWQFSKPAVVNYWRPRRRVTSYDADRKRRRRSSQPGTGAATPNPRQSIGPRESFVGVHEPSSNREQPKDDEGLAAQLDPAFQNPRAPGPSTRRISSMLARSDLTGSEMFNDGIVGLGANAGLRRGPSLNATSAVGRSFKQASERHQDLRSSMRSDQGFVDEDDSSDDEDLGTTDLRRQFASLMSSTKGIRMDLKMKLLQSVSVDESIGQDLDVFTCESQSGVDTEEVMLCVVNRPGGELLRFHIKSVLSKYSDAQGKSVWQTQVQSVSRTENVIDACQFVDGLQSRLLTLEKSPNGSHEISIQSMASETFKFLLPDRLLINFPYELSNTSSSSRRRLTGPKRLINNLPLPLTAAVRGAGNAQAIVIDREGTGHRLQFKIQPTSSFIKTCLDICQLTTLGGQSQHDTFTNAWWQVLSFLTQKKPQMLDPEWTAFVVLVLTLCRPEMAPFHPPTPIRSTRRKGGLLRSSSGASTDLTDFHAMVSQEGAPVSAVPTWMDNSAWEWALHDQPTNTPTPGLGIAATNKPRRAEPDKGFKNSSFLTECLSYGQEFGSSSGGKQTLEEMKLKVVPKDENFSHADFICTVLCSLHLYREELKLGTLTDGYSRQLTPLLAQLGGWLGWDAWSWSERSVYAMEDTGLRSWCFDEVSLPLNDVSEQPIPPSVSSHVAQIYESGVFKPFPSLSDICPTNRSAKNGMERFLPKTGKILRITELALNPEDESAQLLHFARHDHLLAETTPEGIAAPLRSCLSLQQANPDTHASDKTLRLLDRDDLAMLSMADQQIQPLSRSNQGTSTHSSLRDNHAICRTMADDDQSNTGKTDASVEIDRAAVTRMIFREDQRVREANKILHPLEPPTIRCLKEPDWSEQEFLEAEQELAKVVANRTLSVCAGRGLLLFAGRSPLLTERFPTHGFTLSCVMKPSNNTVTAEKETFTEEKVSWAFFHAGAEAGLSISKNSKGIDTSWIVFNKPLELNNRHAGFLLALGLNGHLKNIAKWVAFKYLTPKHTMTSIGLLLGLAASYLGTMDTLIIRLLSVHVTRMLPPGAAELNLSPLTQTTGILALGLLYCETQHRRMSEIMLSEMEKIELEENDNPLDTLRDEGYRLAAGFALGYINLGQGKNLQGLRDMHLVERLLALAVSTKRVDLVHVLDKASAAATVAIALIFMKSEDEALAKKIDIPDTIQQFEYVRPDLFLLRTVARHLIMWAKIEPSAKWLTKQLPPVFRKAAKLSDISTLDIKDLPLYNTIAGICLAIGLRFAGTARADARDLLISQLDQFMRLARLPALSYDHRLTRTTVRNCQDTIALAAACVMAGTGDILLFRRLRSLHGRIDPETPYGSHMAVHQAVGALFLAGGTHTFTTSNLAIASLLCAFYPLFPTSVLDNKGHLQAFRHLWVLATEPRCLVVRSVDTHRPLPMPVSIQLRKGTTLSAHAPCLLPPPDSIARIELTDPRYWRVALDLEHNPAHRAAFARHQSMFARRKGAGAHDPDASPFSIAMQALADEDANVSSTTTGGGGGGMTSSSFTGGGGSSGGGAPAAAAGGSVGGGTAMTGTTAGLTTGSGSGSTSISIIRQRDDTNASSSLEWIFDLPSFKAFSMADRSLALPPEVPLANHAGSKGSAVDDRLMLRLGLDVTSRADRLWSLRVLFAWADGVARRGDGDGDGDDHGRETDDVGLGIISGGAGGTKQARARVQEGEEGGEKGNGNGRGNGKEQGMEKEKEKEERKVKGGKIGWLEREVISGLRAELGVRIAGMSVGMGMDGV